MSQVNVRNRKRSDGSNNWEYRFEIAKQDGKRKRISKSGFKTKKEAFEEGSKAFLEYNNAGYYLKPSEMSFNDYLDLYLKKYAKNQLQLETYINYEKKIRLYIKPFLGDYKLSALNPLIISDLFDELKNKGYSKNTLIGVKTVLMSAFNYAVNPLKLVQNSPMVYVKIPNMGTTKQTSAGGVRSDGKKNGAVKGSNAHIYIEKPKMDEIFNRFPKWHPDHIPLVTGYALGVRLGEAYALTWEDFDFKNKTVTISKQVQWNQSKGRWYIKAPKYESIRTISISDEYAQIIKEKILQSKKDRLYYGQHYTRLYLNDDGEINEAGEGPEIHLINIRENGTYINPRSMQHCSSIIHNQLDFKEFDFHSLRHTHATDLLKAGATPKYVQYRLGHKTIKVTLEIYEHITEEIERTESRILNEIKIN